MKCDEGEGDKEVGITCFYSIGTSGCKVLRILCVSRSWLL